MPKHRLSALAAWFTVLLCGPLHAQDPADAVCARPLPGAVVQAPPELRSRRGVLETTLHLRSAFDRRHLQRFCYVTDDGLISPTLRVHPGDTLLIHFRNELRSDILQQTGIPQAEHPHAGMDMPDAHAGTQPSPVPTPTLPSRTNPDDAPCFSIGMSARGSNLHFHGMGVAPVCHQDDVLHTLVLSGQSFDYRVHVPEDESPGLYWYHPHGHGYTEAQVLGGASGAIIVDPASVEVAARDCQPSRSGEPVLNAVKESACAPAHPGRGDTLPERTLVLRDALVTEGTAEAHKADTDLPTWDLSLNFVPVLYPQDVPARLELAAGRRELWRVLNAAADLTYDLEYVVNGKPQPFAVRALDGVALSSERTETHLLLPPGARAEAVVTTPAAGAHAELRTRRVDTGPDGETEPPRHIAEVVARPTHVDQEAVAMNGAPNSSATQAKPAHVAISTEAERSGETPVFAPADAGRSSPALYQRVLYFSERAVNPASKEGYVQFFLTPEGKQPKQYEMGQPPDITVHQGAVERWTIENRARELHVFHIHQLHFRVVAVNGVPTDESALRDTVAVPYWTGTGPFPSVTVELDFRSRSLIGSFVYHCHILGHEDAGMMGGIEVLPHGLPSTAALGEDREGLSVRVRGTQPTASPTGTVQFQQAGKVVAESTLADGVARLPKDKLRSKMPVVAVYTGDRFSDGTVSNTIVSSGR